MGAFVHNKYISVGKLFPSFDGTKIYYEITKGESREKLLILLHGFAGDLTAWNSEKKILLEQGYSIVAVDLRGHGFSDKPNKKNSYNIKNFVQDICLMIKREKIKKPIIIGHCFGGMIGMSLAAHYPHILDALVLIDSNYRLPWFSDLIVKHNSMLSFIHFLLSRMPDSKIKVHADYRSFKNTSDYNWKRILYDVSHTTLKTFLMMYEEVDDYNGLSLLKKIQIPTLVIEGLNDKIFPPEIAEGLHNRIINSDLRLIKNANHILVINNPRELTQTILSFLHKIHY